MPTYRVRTRDGAEQNVQAIRIRADGEKLSFENRVRGMWRPALELRLDDVERVQRRLNEADGSWTWVTERVDLPSS